VVLDTHVLIWFCLDDPRLSQNVKNHIEQKPEEVFISSITLWEMALAHQKGRLGLQVQNLHADLLEVVDEIGIRIVDLTAEHAILARTLEFDHHDPADRFIAATAFALQKPLATADPKLHNLPWLKTIQ